VLMSMPASDHFADAAVRGMVGGGVDRGRAMEGGPPQPYPMSCLFRAWLYARGPLATRRFSCGELR
jgi:hypothetical protein